MLSLLLEYFPLDTVSSLLSNTLRPDDFFDLITTYCLFTALKGNCCFLDHIPFLNNAEKIEANVTTVSSKLSLTLGFIYLPYLEGC